MTLESLVSSINSISLNMSRLEVKLENNERKANDMMSIITTRENLAHNDPQLNTRGYLEQLSSQVSFSQSNVNAFTKKETYHTGNESTVFAYTNTFTQKEYEYGPPNVKTDHLIQSTRISDLGKTNSYPADLMNGNSSNIFGSEFNTTGAQLTYNQSSRFGTINLIERCAEDRIKDEENLDEGDDNIEEEEDNGDNVVVEEEEEMRGTIERKLINTQGVEFEIKDRGGLVFGQMTMDTMGRNNSGVANFTDNNTLNNSGNDQLRASYTNEGLLTTIKHDEDTIQEDEERDEEGVQNVLVDNEQELLDQEDELDQVDNQDEEDIEDTQDI